MVNSEKEGIFTWLGKIHFDGTLTLYIHSSFKEAHINNDLELCARERPVDIVCPIASFLI